MKFVKTTMALLALCFAAVIPATANAANETAEASFDLTPRSGSFTQNALSPANWSVETEINTTDPKILPMKVADLQFPAGQMTFNPGSTPVCPDSQVGPPPTNMSVPVQTVVDRCPDSVLGNGTAIFMLGKFNNNNAKRDGVMVIFNGGLKEGRPLIKVYAYSYDTQVGIYTEAALQTDGSLRFEIPELTADSAVKSLNLAIPSTQKTLENWGPGQETVILPAGVNKNYVQAKCSSGSWPFSAEFTLGERSPIVGPESTVTDSGTTACTAGTAKARIGSVSVSGPTKVRRNKSTGYKVVIRNSGTATASGVRLRVSGRGIAVNARVGTIAAGKSRTVTLRAKFRSKGRIKTAFKVTSNNAGGKTVNRTITVR
jgi:hypothetical protein